MLNEGGKFAGILASLVVIVLAFWIFVSDYTYDAPPEAHIGGFNVPDHDSVVSLVNSTVPVDANSYDSYQLPRGTDYVVPEDKRLVITEILGGPLGNQDDTHLNIGYGDTSVSNDASAPDNEVIAFSTTWSAAEGQMDSVHSWISIPEGKRPFLLSNREMSAQVIGVEIDLE